MKIFNSVMALTMIVLLALLVFVIITPPAHAEEPGEYFIRDTIFNVPLCMAVLIKTKEAMVQEGEFQAGFFYERMAQRLLNVMAVFTSKEDITNMYIAEATKLDTMIEDGDKTLKNVLSYGIWCAKVAKLANPERVVVPDECDGTWCGKLMEERE